MKNEELVVILDEFLVETDKEISRVQKDSHLYGEEITKLALATLKVKKNVIDFIRDLIKEPDCRNDSEISLTVFAETGNRVAIIETPGRYKDQDTTLMVRVSEIPDSEKLKIEYLHTEDSGEVLQETFYCQRMFWDLVQHEVEKLKKFKKYNTENPLSWYRRKV